MHIEQLCLDHYLNPGEDQGGCLSWQPVVLACDTGTIPFSYHNGCRNCAHSYDHALAKPDTSAGAWDYCPTYFVNFWAVGLSSKLNKAQFVTCIV